MIIKGLNMDDISACADILCAVYNNELWMCRWDKKTAMDYLQDFYDHKKFVGCIKEFVRDWSIRGMIVKTLY